MRKRLIIRGEVVEKPKAYTRFVQYLKVFKDDLYLIIFEKMARGM